MRATINGRLNTTTDLQKNHFDNFGFINEENIENKKCYYELNLNDHWYTNNSWSNANDDENSAKVIELLKLEESQSRNSVKNLNEEGIPILSKYAGWNSTKGDFYVSEELPNNRQKLKTRFEKLNKIKYQLTAFLFGTLLIITLVSSLVARF